MAWEGMNWLDFSGALTENINRNTKRLPLSEHSHFGTPCPYPTNPVGCTALHHSAISS